MTLNDIARLRLISQQLAETRFKTPVEIVHWMGAVQAQDYPMAQWAIGIRLPGSTEKMIEKSIDGRKIIRTHVLRPTWHLVAANDVRWMLKLTAPRIKAKIRAGDRALGLTESLVRRSNRLIRNSLEKSGPLTREELAVVFRKARIPTDMNRAWHLLANAELDEIICSGPARNGKNTYALLDEWVPRGENLSKEESLSKLARRYILSHGPATVEDFAWWSGLSLGEGRQAFSLIGSSDVISETIGSQRFWFSASLARRRSNKRSIHLLPAYDEFIISYKDRSASVSPEHQTVSISDNGIFRPAIIVNGRVSGLWKRYQDREKTVVELNLFRRHSVEEKESIRESIRKFERFLGKKIRMETAESRSLKGRSR